MHASARLLLISVAVVAVSLRTTEADKTQTSGPPKVVLVGDSIRLSYAAIVVERLGGKAIVVSPRANGGDSGNVLKHPGSVCTATAARMTTCAQRKALIIYQSPP